MVRVLLFVLLLSVPLASADLAVGFYDSSCPQAESVVRAVVAKHFHADHSIAAAFLRLYFHDCFVRGCDASILIDGTNTTDSEKSAFPNKTVRGYEIIDDIKQNLESQCPSTVSCADVIALATRDVVSLARGLHYAVPTGQRDGLVSNPANVSLPGPSSPMSVIQQAFGPKGFTLEETVVLLGAHTVGSVHCAFIQPDPSMDARLKRRLAKLCRGGDNTTTAFLDQATPFVVDNRFYKQVMRNKGVMGIDQELGSDNSTAPIVRRLAKDREGFLNKFTDVLVKMGSLDVLVGSEGEIRTNCRAFNN
ncbi:peroxidase 44-like [Ananas comosus]|uniref:Peroxidase n=1 Tax=Ananas comosus TaxID=4615 RepID=A0A199VCA2_ANACO|nr:peroxidase 44-like [Ananas comosus]OAY74648.1 Peroxidase 44 [Ananas comosus]